VQCDECGFRDELWSVGDRTTTLKASAARCRQVLDGAPRLVQAEMTKLLAPVSLDPPDLHALMHALHLAGRLRHAGSVSAQGVAAQLNRSGGGVPKLPVEQVGIGFGGLTGDVQQNRRHHGRPWQAVCLWSAEVIEGLQAEGHPIGFGSAGENVTVRGLDWAAISPGSRLRVGSALLQVTSYAVPCVKNRQWFADADITRMAQEVRPGSSRLYASVLAEGTVRQGDPVVLEPLGASVAAPS
jgi:MOSC domain-containing protein YiiM